MKKIKMLDSFVTAFHFILFTVDISDFPTIRQSHCVP